MKLTIFPLKGDKSPAVPKGTDWRDYVGEANTKLIGIAVPLGVVIFDTDLHKGVTYEQINEGLGAELDWEASLLQTTMNDGKHHAFLVPLNSDIVNGKDVLGIKGFDIRSAGKGYIATGEGYEDETFIGVIEALKGGYEFPPLPFDVLALISSEPDEANDLERVIANQPLDLTIEEIDGYLSKLTPEHSADQWLNVIMAIHHQFNGSEEGYERADAFSKLCPEKYNEKVNRTRWDSLKDSKAKPYTFASIIKMVGGRDAISNEQAQTLLEKISAIGEGDKAGLDSLLIETAKASLNEIDQLLVTKELSKAFKQATGESVTAAQINKLLKGKRKNKKAKGEYVADYIYLTGAGEFMDRVNKTTMGVRSFDFVHTKDTPTGEDGEVISASAFAQNKIEIAHSAMYAPHLGASGDVFEYNGIAYANTYRGLNCERVKQGTTNVVEAFKRHVAHIIEDDAEQRLFINYLAHCIQFVGKKITWGIALQGVEGDGKSFFSETMKHIMGSFNCSSISAEVLNEKFTGWAENTSLIFIEEVKLDNRQKYDVLNKLKPYITNPTITIRKMNTDAYEAINTANYVMFTNYQDALPLNDNDRRYAIIFSRWQDKKALEQFMIDNPNYYQDLYQNMRENYQEIYDFLASWEIDDEFLSMSRAPMTSAKQKMIDMNKHDDYLIVEDMIVEAGNVHWDINENFVNVTKLNNWVANEMVDMSVKNNWPKTSRLANIMIEMGYYNLGTYKSSEGKNQRIYSKNSKAKALDYKKQEDFNTPF